MPRPAGRHSTASAIAGSNDAAASGSGIPMDRRHRGHHRSRGASAGNRDCKLSLRLTGFQFSPTHVQLRGVPTAKSNFIPGGILPYNR
jgi:hypothetical protein